MIDRRMFGFITVAALASAVPLSGRAAALSATVSPLLPSSSWIVDGEDGECFLERNYGAGTSALILAFRSDPFAQNEISIVLLGRGDLPTGEAVGQIELAPSAQQFRATVLGDTLTDGRISLRLSTEEDSPPPPDALLGTTAITVRVGRFSKALSTPGMASGLKAFRNCNQALIESWGVDPNETSHVKTAARPSTKPGTWITPSDYPAGALASGLQGDTRILYTVGVDGRIKDCRAVVSSGNKGLDLTACQEFTRNGRFSAARDATGNPIESHRVDRINWRIGL